MKSRGVARELRQRHEGFDFRHAGREVVRALHLAAAGGDVARHRAHGVVRGCHRDLHDGLQNERMGFGKSVQHRLAPGGHKRHFLAVHGVGLAVVDRDADVFNRVARKVPGGEHFPNALFHGGDEVEGNDAALHLVHELKACAARQGLHLEEHFAELAGAARLLLVAGMPFGFAPDRLAVGHGRIARRHFKLELILHAFQDRAHVHFREAAQDGFVQDGVVVNGQGRVFGEHLLEHFAHAAFVAPARGLDREAEHRTRIGRTRQTDARVRGIGVKHRAVVELFHLCEGANVARAQLVGFHGVLSLKDEGAHHLEGLFGVPGVELHPRLDRAAVHAEDADLAHKGVAHHLEDAGDDRLAGFGRHDDALALGVHKRRLIRFRLRGHVADDDLHEVPKTNHLLGARKAHRDDVTFAQRLRDRGVQRRRIRRPRFKVALHRFVVYFHHALDEGAVHVRDGHDVGLALVVREAVDHVRAAFGGEVDGENAVPEGVAQFAQEALQVHARGVNLVDDDHAAEVALFGPLHHAAGHEFNALDGVHNHRDVFDGVESGKRLPGVVRVPRGVDHVNAHGREFGKRGVHVDDGGPKRMADGLFLRIVVADGRSFFNAAGFAQRAAAHEHGLDEARLSDGAVADESDRSQVLSGIAGHNAFSLGRNDSVLIVRR